MDDYKRMVEDYRERLAAYQRRAGFALETLGGTAVAAVGLYFHGVLGAMFGTAVGVWVGKAAGPASKPLGRLAFRLSETNRRADRIISTLDFLKKSTSA